jgi:hypothetical protein
MSQDCTTYQAKRASALLYTPPVRYKPYNPYISSTSISPTEQVKFPFSLTPIAYTQHDLDMRRKAEILQYKKNGATSGAATKSRQWANIARSNKSTFIPVNIKTECGASWSNAAGVPGVPVPLYLNPAIPLYNFNNMPTYATELKEDPNIKWTYTANSDIDSLVPHIVTFSITPAITELVTRFTINTAVILKVSGISSSISTNNTFSVKLGMQNIRILTYYGGQLVNYTQQPYPVFNTNFRNDVSGVATGVFTGSLYLGLLQIAGLYLPTSPGYTYDICLNYQPNISSGVNISNLAVSFVSNATSVTTTTTNMSFFTPASQTPLNPFSLEAS